ncbi:MAG: hypothetical protein GJ676_04775 [Rhodobacteraceae bacterium]|nr:hypothetical protein [Paracoccaceae bacterium]
MMTLATLATLFSTPVLAQEFSKAESCDYQSQVVAAVQQARKDRVRERDVPQAIADTNPTWPANFSNAIPLIAPWVYEQKMSIIRNEDLAAVWKDLCLKQP